jgi:hypothetical protein
MAKKRAASTLETFAEDLGKILGTAENKARSWLDQRKSIAQQLTAVRDKADELLRELTGGAAKMASAVSQARLGRPPRSPNTQAGKKKPGRRKFTAAQRKEQGERMRAYWAARKAKTAKKAGRKKAGTGSSNR